MANNVLPPSVATAALLKSRLDQGKDYFDLLTPFVSRGVAELASEVIDPVILRKQIKERFGLELPLRTLAVLLDRLSKRDGSGVRKEGPAYLCVRSLSLPDTASPLVEEFRKLGDSFVRHCNGRLSSVHDTESALGALCAFLEAHSATLVLDGALPSVRTERREDIIIASFLEPIVKGNNDATHALTALLQGLVLSRAVTLTDLAEVEKRLGNLVVYFDTPFVLAIAGMYGPADLEAGRDAVRLLKDLGATPAVFDVTIAEVRRILAVFEDRLDTAEGRQRLYSSPLTAFFLSTNATGADVRERSALLETTLSREGLLIHATPPRQREYVGDEVALAAALADVRGSGYEAREAHDVNCVAAILTLRAGRQPAALEDARAVMAATGMVVKTTTTWWRQSGAKGLAPVLQHSAIINYCWLKRPRTA